MYCEDSAGTDIDHFRPKASYPADAFRWRNFLHACSHCNSNEKRAAFPLGTKGQPLLLDPTADDPYAHLQFVWETGTFIGQTPQGMETERVFGLNRRSALERGRRNTWVAVRALLDLHRASIDAAERKRIREVVRELPFQAVVQHFLRDAIAQRSNVPAAISAEVIATQADWAWAL